ncbi:MAG: multidrug effflux MFS transporter [Burkholderiales bacterium]
MIVDAPPTRRAATGEAGLTALVGVFLMLQPLSTDLYLASLPGLATRFSVPASVAQLTLSLFVAGFGLMQLASGPMSDRWGRRPVVLAALALYVGASLACAAAPTIEVLIAARFLQAVGCCTVVVVARAIVRDAFDPAAGARVLARASSILAIGPIAGPIAGSFLEVAFGFRGAFVLLSAIALALLAVTARTLPETLERPDPAALSPGPIARGYLAMVRSPVFRAYSLAGAASYGGLFAFISGSSFVLIRVLGVPAAWFGLWFASVVVGFLIGTLVCRRILGPLGVARTLRVGALLSAGSGTAAALLALAGNGHVLAVTLPSLGYVIAHGIVFPCAQAGSTAQFPDRAGAAAGLFGALMMGVATTVGFVIGSTHDGTTVPMTLTMATCGLVVLVASRLPGLRETGPR